MAEIEGMVEQLAADRDRWRRYAQHLKERLAGAGKANQRLALTLHQVRREGHEAGTQWCDVYLETLGERNEARAEVERLRAQVAACHDSLAGHEAFEQRETLRLERLRAENQRLKATNHELLDRIAARDALLKRIDDVIESRNLAQARAEQLTAERDRWREAARRLKTGWLSNIHAVVELGRKLDEQLRDVKAAIADERAEMAASREALRAGLLDMEQQRDTTRALAVLREGQVAVLREGLDDIQKLAIEWDADQLADSTLHRSRWRTMGAIAAHAVMANNAGREEAEVVEAAVEIVACAHSLDYMLPRWGEVTEEQLAEKWQREGRAMRAIDAAVAALLAKREGMGG